MGNPAKAIHAGVLLAVDIAPTGPPCEPKTVPLIDTVPVAKVPEPRGRAAPDIRGVRETPVTGAVAPLVAKGVAEQQEMVKGRPVLATSPPSPVPLNTRPSVTVLLRVGRGRMPTPFSIRRLLAENLPRVTCISFHPGRAVPVAQRTLSVASWTERPGRTRASTPSALT